MVVNVTGAMKQPGVEFPFALSEEIAPMEVAGEYLRFQGPVRVNGGVVFTGEDILVNGTIEVVYTASCARCLTDVPSSMVIEFHEEFARTEDDNHPDRYLYQGDEINLDQMVADLIGLQAPTRHLCDPNCRGLCPVCGADRNKVCCCHGADPEGESPFAVD